VITRFNGFMCGVHGHKIQHPASLCVLWITSNKMPECSPRRPRSGTDIHHERILMRPVASCVAAQLTEKEFYEVRAPAYNSASGRLAR
jgi:hypothetical protein